MNKLWQTKLQSSFRDTLTDGAARLKQGWGAAGERPPLAMDTAGSGTAPGKGPQPQYLRLPIDSARKLRWYDREDLSRLIESNLQERQQLAEVNTALREVMLERGMSEEELTTELQSRIEETDRSRFFQEAVHSVLLASAQSEIEHLRQELADSAQQMSQLQSRLAHLETPPEGLSPAASGGLPRHRRQASVASEHSSIFPPSHAGSVAAQSTTAAGDTHSSMPASSPLPSPRQSHAGDTVPGSLSRASPSQPATALSASQAQAVEPHDATAGVPSDQTAVDSVTVDSVPAQQGEANSPQASSSGRGPAASDSAAGASLPTASAGTEGAAGYSNDAPNPSAEHDISAAYPQQEPSSSQQRPPSAGKAGHSHEPVSQQDPEASTAAPPAETDGSGPQEALPSSSGGEHVDAAGAEAVSLGQKERESDRGPEQPHVPHQQQPARDKGKNAEPDPHLTALLGKLQRVEEERQHLLEMSTANAEHAAALESQLQTAEAQLSSTRQTLAESREVAERQLQELRGKLTNCQNQQAEMLRRAQDICLSAEDRAEKAEAKLEKVQAQAARIELELKESRAEAKRLTNELKAREKDLQARDKDCERASGRAVQAEAALAEAKQAGRAEAEKGASVSTLLANARRAADEREAELRKAMREGEAKLQTRNGQLESDIATLRRSVERLEGDVELLEKRATEAESAEAELLQELKQSESVAADRDMLAARAAALEEKVEEGRVERGQVASLRQLAAEAEAARARVEEEVLATARIATGLEARLRTARAEADAAQRDALAANERCSKAEARVDVEVAERLEACGAQRNLWPGPAQEEISRLEVRAQGLQSMLAAVQEDLDDAANLRQQLEVASAGLQARATAAEERVVRLERENRQAADRLHRQVSAAKAEVKEWKREARAAEEERQRWGPKGPPDRHVAPTSPSWAPTSPTTPLPTLNGSARASGRGGGGLHGLAAGGSLGDREAMNGVDMLYLKNVLLKFVEAHALGRLAERDALVPAIATLLRATPAEFRALRVAMSQGNPNWWLSKA
ncbi:hypothetical protein WJX74_002575 [Apatococcus lobatus]|uniref:GRIP domain-containing protein n=1 Tax=Apatococcus lobatus TaxID=904363 RepID=A0AAW1QWA5_9CHLO